jgi:hypothetical protein
MIKPFPMRIRLPLIIHVWLVTALPATLVSAEGIRLGTNTVVVFASVQTGRKILTNRDDFVSALSEFDRAARLKTDQAVSENQYLHFVAQSVMPWSPGETNRITGIFQNLEGQLMAWHLPFPPTIYLVKTSGREEGDASYTRQNAVVFCGRDLQLSKSGLDRLITHELFHILSRQNPQLRKELYDKVGFHPMGSMEFPEELQQRKITDPDGVQYNWFITITNQGRTLRVIPLLYASTPHYVPGPNGEFFDDLTFRLLAVTNDGTRWAPERFQGQLQLIDPAEARGFFEQIGNNTGYIIHPDEILADNFVLLINGTTNLPTPRIIADMKRVFMAHDSGIR